jgi:hypothetical protein
MEKIIYAIIANKGNPAQVNEIAQNIRGITGSNLYALTFEDISVAISDFPASKFVVSKELAIDFARVIEELSQHLTVLPIRFGTAVKSDEIVNQLMSGNYHAFLNNLLKVENKHEFGLKVIWDYDKCSEKIKKIVESEPYTIDTFFTKSTVSTNYLLEKVKKHRLEDALLKHVEQLIEEISWHLTQINPESKFKKMLSQSIILDGVFLVEKAKKEAFIKAIEALNLLHDDLHFLLTGPWPPYSFVEITIEKD